MLEGFILGLSNGVTCVAYCAPVLIPYLLGEGKRISQNSALTVQFLLGRLSGYLLFAVFAWGINHSILQWMSKPDLLIGGAYVIFSVLLIFYGFFKTTTSCAASRINGLRHKWVAIMPFSLPIIAGFVTGLSFCPPFLLAFTGAIERTSLLKSMLFFFAFFLGTSIFFIPTPFVGIFRGFSTLKMVGKMAAGLIGVYYLYSGIVMLIGGISRI
ncbi:MAG: sulfite exporter TauE/SafE family protein [Proteobacteria bacterium]|nr:sulfite exporter TauE/SafE family protein [Pseudomonadota bacterium]